MSTSMGSCMVVGEAIGPCFTLTIATLLYVFVTSTLAVMYLAAGRRAPGMKVLSLVLLCWIGIGVWIEMSVSGKSPVSFSPPGQVYPYVSGNAPIGRWWA